MTTMEMMMPNKCVLCGESYYAHLTGLALDADPAACRYKPGPKIQKQAETHECTLIAQNAGDA